MKNAENTNRFIISEQPGNDGGDNDLTEELKAFEREMKEGAFDFFEGDGSKKSGMSLDEGTQVSETGNGLSSEKDNDECRQEKKSSSKRGGRRKSPGRNTDVPDENIYFHVRFNVDPKTRRRIVLLKSYFDSKGESFGDFLNEGFVSLVSKKFEKEREDIFNMFSGS